MFRLKLACNTRRSPAIFSNTRHWVRAWNGRQLVSERWLRELATPSAANPSYGCLWWLNTGRKLVPSAPETSVFALGGGQNVIWVDEMRDLVMVVRLLVREHLDGLIARVIANLH